MSFEGRMKQRERDRAPLRQRICEQSAELKDIAYKFKARAEEAEAELARVRGLVELTASSLESHVILNKGMSLPDAAQMAMDIRAALEESHEAHDG